MSHIAPTLFCYAVTIGACYCVTSELYDAYTFSKRRDEMYDKWTKESKETEKVMMEQWKCYLELKMEQK